jgi:hypothetical protein
VLQVREQLVLLAQQAQLVYKVLAEQQGHRVQPVLVLQVSLVLTVLTDRPVLLVHKVIRVPLAQAQQELKEQQVPLARRVLTELMEPQALLVLLVLLV